MNCAYFLTAVCDPIVLWRSKKPRCFKKLKNIYLPHGVHYFANAKVNVLLFLDNAPSHPDIFQEGLKNTNLEFLPKKVLPKITT